MTQNPDTNPARSTEVLIVGGRPAGLAVAAFESEESMLASLNDPDHADIQARLVASIVKSKFSTQFLAEA